MVGLDGGDLAGDQVVAVVMPAADVGDQFAVPQRDHPVGELDHLVEPVGDEDHAGTPVGDPPHGGEQRADLISVQRGGRLVEDEDVARVLPAIERRGFFTSRVIATFINEGIAMLAEGIPAASIEQASMQAGYPAPVLQLADEINLKLMRMVRRSGIDAVQAAGGIWESHPSEVVVDQMLDEFDRPGRLQSAGFYEYVDGRRDRLWPGLADVFAPDPDKAPPLADLVERMLFVESLEAIRCLEEGVIESVADANVGSILGIGFPGWTGGVLQYANGYRGGPAGFLARARGLRREYGVRFDPPPLLTRMAADGGRFADRAAEESAA